MMAYQEGLVASIYVNDKPIREFNYKGQRTCRIPFGSEYQILIKNKSPRRGLISVDIDGMDVLGCKQLIIRPHDQLLLGRFVDDLDVGKKFKFISLNEGIETGEIQDPTSKDNGLITIKFYKETEPLVFLRSHNIHPHGTIAYTNGTVTASAASVGASPQAGATVEGGESKQKFSLTHHDFDTEPVPVELSIKLIGIPNQQLFGVFINNNKKPSYEFKDRMSAFRFVEINNFGDSKIMIKEV